MTAQGMVIARRSAWVPHAVLIAGLALVLFPIYVALVASSHELAAILEAPMTLMPVFVVDSDKGSSPGIA